MNKDFYKKLIFRCQPLILTSCLWLFIIFMVLGFIIPNNVASNILFGLSFASLILYIPTFLLTSKLRKKDWFIAYEKLNDIKKLEKNNKNEQEIKDDTTSN